jgi:tetratricopeptide (TPR) repeat protein
VIGEETVEGTPAAFEELRIHGAQAIEAGRLEEAERYFDEAFAWAQQHGDANLVDLALCNRAAAAIDLGRGERELPRLREILMRGADPVNCRIAAYNIARYYELNKSFKKALFYGQIARDRSEHLGRRDWLASSHNLIGNLLLAESFFEKACAEFEQALALSAENAVVRRALIKDNLGYCYVVQGRYSEGFRLLFESYRSLRHAGAIRYSVLPRVALCFAYLEVGRPERALRCGREALETIEATGGSEMLKNVLYLLGEAANLNGDLDLARIYFGRLQREFYPEAGYLPDFLLAIDVRKLINLKA